MTPDYRRDNPYQELLAKSLAEYDVDVVFPRGYRRVLPLSRSAAANSPAKTLHLHWLSPFLKGTGAKRLVYVIKLALDLSLLKLRGWRLVWTVHNLLPHDTPNPKIDMLSRRLVSRLADVIITHDDTAKKDVSKYFGPPEAKITVIPHASFEGVYGQKTDPPEARSRLKLPQQGIIYLFFGMLRPYKGVVELLDAWSNTPEMQDATLIIAGKASDPEYAAEVRERAARCPNVITRLDFIPDDEVRLYFSAVDVAVYPFRTSLTSGSVLLASAFDVPVIAPDIGSVRHALADGVCAGRNILYSASDPDALRTSLIHGHSIARWDAPKRECNTSGITWDHTARLHAEAYALFVSPGFQS